MKQRKKLIMLCGLMLAVSSPTYAENATEAVSISDTASVVELTSDANMETEMQSVSDSDTTETSAQETDQVALPAIWQETYTFFIFHTEIGWKMKTRSFDRKAVKKVSPESCPNRTRGAKKGNKERKQKWISVFVALTAMW